MRHIFRIDDGEYHLYSAESKEQALEMQAEASGYKTVAEYFEDMDDEIEVEQLLPEDRVTVNYEDDCKVTKSAKKWAEEVEGFLASSVW